MPSIVHWESTCVHHPTVVGPPNEKSRSLQEKHQLYRMINETNCTIADIEHCIFPLETKHCNQDNVISLEYAESVKPPLPSKCHPYRNRVPFAGGNVHPLLICFSQKTTVDVQVQQRTGSNSSCFGDRFVQTLQPCFHCSKLLISLKHSVQPQQKRQDQS